MNILFHSNQLGVRGTEVALYDYAHYNETILGNVSYIAAPANSDMSALDKFKNRFGDRVIIYNTFGELGFSSSYRIDVAYFIKAGFNDGLLIPGIKNIVHVVFQHYEPHGDHYVYIAEWLTNKMSKGVHDFIPHIIKMEDHEEDYRDFLKIPKEAIVFGRHGGYEEFNYEFTYDPIIQTAKNNPNIYFVLMNTKPFSNGINNIIYIGSSYDLSVKRAFINTCDAMIHGRRKGEVFSMSIGEFLYCNKPIVTTPMGEDSGHLHMLKDKGLYYNSGNELYAILNSFEKKEYNMKSLVDPYTPEAIMKKFKTLL
jgi:hypothetical protein